jgi:hypothetical protein
VSRPAAGLARGEPLAPEAPHRSDPALPAASRSGARASRWVGALLWVAALVAMLSAAVYQRTTGPTYPQRGVVAVGGEVLQYRLVRSASTAGDATVRIPDPGAAVTGRLVHRRYPTAEAYQSTPLVREDGHLVGRLPGQPAAGKVEYYLELAAPEGMVRIPAEPADDPVLRFKDPVPAAALAPHVILMFLAMLVGIRAGLGAVAGRADARRWAWTALGLMTVGGMILGPVVQKYAFGAYWTGFPLGYDLTDNKTLVMWLAWVGACAVLGWRPAPGRRATAGRAAVAAAAVVMLAVYLIPHSMRGSELDYQQVETGVDPADAIRTGR